MKIHPSSHPHFHSETDSKPFSRKKQATVPAFFSAWIVACQLRFSLITFLFLIFLVCVYFLSSLHLHLMPFYPHLSLLNRPRNSFRKVLLQDKEYNCRGQGRNKYSQHQHPVIRVISGSQAGNHHGHGLRRTLGQDNPWP